MRKVRVSLRTLGSSPINIGYVGENEHCQVVISSGSIFEDYPDAVATLMVQLPNGDTYPKEITRSGNDLIWTVVDSDLGLSGAGRYQLTFTESGEVIKSIIGGTQIDASLDGEAVPTPVESWIEEATEKLEEMEAATEAVEELTVAATTLAAGSDATAAVTDVDGHKHIAFGIPKGDKGDKGDPGEVTQEEFNALNDRVGVATLITGNQYRLSL